jgi:myo-inositol-1(or 4)-monophosphatase
MHDKDRKIPAELEELSALVRVAARAEILPRYEQVQASRKSDGSLVTAADVAVQEYLCAALKERWPDYAMLGEEMTAEEQQRLLEYGDGGLWCLDPLDGTSNFANGIPFFAVSLALLRQGQPEWALVYDPLRDECFSAQRGQGAWLNGRRLLLNPVLLSLRQAIAVVDGKRLSRDLRLRLAEQQPWRSQRNFGSCALEWCWLAAGRFGVYLHGGQKLWDHAAGGLILAEAGGYAMTLAGEPVFQCTLTPRSVVAASGAALLKEWADALGIAI